MVKTYSVNTCDAWLQTVGDDPAGSFVRYEDYAALEIKMLALLEHPAVNAFAEALAAAQITGLAFIRVNANGYVQVLSSDRVQLSVIQAVEERAHVMMLERGDATPPPRPFLKPSCGHDWQSEFDGVGYEDICSKCGEIK